MSAAKLALDPLWQCICPAWTARLPILQSTRRTLAQKHPLQLHSRTTAFTRAVSDYHASRYGPRRRDNGAVDYVLSPLADASHLRAGHAQERADSREYDEGSPTLYPPRLRMERESTASLYRDLRAEAIDGKVELCRQIARYLVEERKEEPSHSIYSALILSNIHHENGSAWRVAELLDEMRDDGLQLDSQTCHAALKVLSVHLDHLLRADMLQYMSKKWIQLSEDGAHDVMAGLLREGLFEQALDRLDKLQGIGAQIRPWLLDMVVYVLCEADEISDAYRIMRQRVDSPEPSNIGRSVWAFLLDKASSARHHGATALVWSNQVAQKYLNPPSGVCLNVLATAARAADAVMATEVFTHLSKRGTPFQPLHYELLISTYLAANPPDLPRAIAVLSIMAGEKVEPTAIETRPFYVFLRDKPHLLPSALQTLRDLHEQNRIIPIAALNLLIECYIEQRDLASALKIYKQIHTFVPLSAGVQKTFANVDTFNLLLKGCRVSEPPEAEQASFLMSEMQALGIKSEPLTYDRLILASISAAQYAFVATDTEAHPTSRSRGLEFLDAAYNHFVQMQEQCMPPRLGTVETLSIELAKMGDERCWDILQMGDDGGEAIQGWRQKGDWTRKKVEEAWTEAICGKKTHGAVRAAMAGG